jgi:hypothetical protein
MNKYIVSGLASLALLSGCGKDPAASKPAAKSASSQLEDRTQAIIAYDGVRIDLLASETQGLQNGMKLSIEPYKRDQWLQFVPVHCEIPSIKYVASLPIQDGMSSAKLTLGKPEQIVGNDLYIIGEKNGRKVVLYKMQMGAR